MRERGRSMHRRSRGFTLLELLVAAALLSVLAVLSWRGMDSVLRGRDRIVSASDDLRAMTVTLTQMEEDLRRSWPIRLLGLPEPAIAFSIGTDREPPALGLLRETRGADAVQVQRVMYRLREGVFERGFSLWAAPSPDGERQVPAVPFTWQPLLHDVQAVQFRGWVQGRGWLPASALAQAMLAQPPASVSAGSGQGSSTQAGSTQGGAAQGGSTSAGAVSAAQGLPPVTGVELTLVHRGERVVRVFAVSD